METRNIGGAEFLVWYGEKKLGKNPTCRSEILLPSLHPLAFLASFLDSLSFFLPVYSSFSYNSSVTFLLISLCSFAFIKRFQYLSYLSPMQFS